MGVTTGDLSQKRPNESAQGSHGIHACTQPVFLGGFSGDAQSGGGGSMPPPRTCYERMGGGADEEPEEVLSTLASKVGVHHKIVEEGEGEARGPSI